MMPHAVQVVPPSTVRKRPSLVPANIVEGDSWLIAKQVMLLKSETLPIVLGSLENLPLMATQVAPLSLERNKPSAVVAYRVEEWTASTARMETPPSYIGSCFQALASAAFTRGV